MPRGKLKKEDNGFGGQTYWNRPSQGRTRTLASKYPSLRTQRPNLSVKTAAGSTQAPGSAAGSTRPPSNTPRRSRSPSRSPSPQPSLRSQAHSSSSTNTAEDNDAKDEKAIAKLMKCTLPQFSNELDWEMAIFELRLVLARVWPHKEEMDITEYMTNNFYRKPFSSDMEERADTLIYYALTMSAKKGSYAKLQILAACHKDAVPCVMVNEGRKLFQMFQELFTMTNLHQASLPTVRVEFYAITQRDKESILAYTSRVDIIVATLAKLGEKVSTGAWIHALGNGLRSEFKECKDGVLYSKPGYDNVLSVKTKLLSEEAVLHSKSKSAKDQPTRGKGNDDEIALKLQDVKISKDAKERTNNKAPDTSTDTAFLMKGKGGKGTSKGKGYPKGAYKGAATDQPWANQWNQPDKSEDYYQNNWERQPKGKGKGKWTSRNDRGTGFNPQTLWCDIHQTFGHTTDWCFDNPNRSGGPPLREWCNHHQAYGHSTEACRKGNGSPIPQLPSHGKGKQPNHYKGGKGNHGDRQWKSQNFPAAYNPEQAHTALHEESSPTQSADWWKTDEVGSVLIHDDVLPMAPIDEHDDTATAEYIDLVILAIFQNIERQQEYLKHPTTELKHDVHRHSQYILRAENQMGIHTRRIINNFKTLIRFEECMSTLQIEQKTLPGYEPGAPIELKLNEPKLNGHTLIELKLNEPELNRHTNKESIQTQKRNEAERHTLLSHNQNVNDNNESLLTQQRHECEELIPQERNERDELIPQQRNECDELIPQQRHECDELIPQQRHECEELIPQERNESNALIPQQRNECDELIPHERHEHDELIPPQRQKCEDLIQQERNERDELIPQQRNECDELIPQERNECDELIPQQLPYEQTDLDPPDTILMTSDDAQWALDVIHEINDEKSKLTSDLRQLEQEGEQVHQHAMDQLHDDIIHEEDASIDRIINAFESLPHSDSDDGSVADYIRAHYRDVPDPPDPSADDLDENTDTEDDADEVIGLLGANQEFMQASQKFLRVNQEFIALFGRQRNTIARLRARISRLVCQLHNASCAQNETIETTNPKTDSEDLHEEIATVLMDINRDISLILKPNCDSNAKMDFHQFGFPHHPRVKKELKLQLAKIQAHENTDSQLWMYYDSGASRSVISTGSPIRKHLKGLTPSYGSCSIGNGTPLQYIEKGHVDNNLEITVVQDLKYDLFSSVSAAKNGLTSIIDFDLRTGQNNSYTIDKATGAITPLVERGKGILELPLHLMFETGTCLISTQVLPASSAELSPNLISTFWHHYDDDSFDPITRNNNRTEYSLFTFDVLKSLNEREQHFLIHARLGHLPRKSIMQMIKNGTTGIAQYSGKFKELCKPCLQAKQRAENHGHEHKRHPHGRPGEHLHSDLAVLSTLDLNGNKYVLTVVDEISHEIVVALLKRKTAEDVCRISKKIQLLISARTGNKLLTWQFDRGTEFLNSAFEAWLKMDLGVVQRFSNVEHPWENGVAERSFQTLFSLSRSLLKHADLPDRLWGKAVLHSVYLSNRSPTAGLGGIAPLQFRTKEPIDLTHMRVFGSPAQIFVRATIRDDVKLSDRSVSGTFVGISDKGNGYIFLVSKSNEVVEIDAKDAKFNETFADIRERKGKLTNAHYISPDLTEVTDKDPDDQNCDGKQERNSDQLYQQPQGEDDGNDGSNGRRRRQVTPRKFLLPGTHLNQSLTPPEAELNIRRQQYLNVCLDNTIADTDAIFVFDCMTAQRNTESKLTKELELLNACLYNEQPHNMLLSAIMQANEVNLNIADPKSQGEIDKMEPNDAKRFNDATTYEVKGMKNKDVFENITMNDLPRGTPIYQSIVNWTSKTNLGVYVKTKCRICFGGHRYDKSFSDTFAPTVNFCTVLIMICLSAMFRWYLGSLDYSQAYLNADIDELCVMRAPIAVREFNSQGQEYYWKMKKAIYGHPKASRLWADCLHKKLLELGYCQFLTDQCVYGRWTNWDANGIHNNEIPKHSSFIFLLIHSDDIIIVSHDEHVMNNAKAELLQVFEGTDNGNLKSFCGVEVNVNDNQISLSMEYYWKKLMTKFNIEPDDIENSPLKTKIKRSECPAEPDEQLKTSYLQIIGSIIYGYTHCRLDLAFPVNMLTRVMHSPAEQHYNLLKKLLYYINGTKDWTLNYFKDDTVFYGMDLTFFCNVDSAHADDDESHRSTGGWFFFLRQGQGAVAAKSGQTKDIPLSSTESETIWGSNAAMQGAFIKQFLDETKLFRNTSFELHEDSQPMINAQKRNVSQSRFKHIKTKHHYIRKLIFDGWCKLVKIPTKMNTADMATKILPAKTVSIFSRVVLGLQDTLPYFTESEQY